MRVMEPATKVGVEHLLHRGELTLLIRTVIHLGLMGSDQTAPTSSETSIRMRCVVVRGRIRSIALA